MPHFPRLRALALFGRRLVERAERLGIAGVQKPAQLRTCRRTRPIGLPIGDIQGVGRAMLQFVTRKNFQHGRELTPGSGQSA